MDNVHQHLVIQNKEEVHNYNSAVQGYHSMRLNKLHVKITNMSIVTKVKSKSVLYLQVLAEYKVSNIIQQLQPMSQTW